MLKQLVCAAVVCATSSVAVAGNGTNLTKYVADTTQTLFVMDVSSAKSSKLIKDGFAKLLDTQPDARAKLDEIGLDPLRDIDTIMFAFGGFDSITNMGDNSALTIIVEGRFPKEALSRLKNATKSTQNGVDVFANDDTEGAIIDGKLFFARKGQIGDVIALAKGKSKASLAKGSAGKDLRETIKHASTKMHLWGAVVLPAADRQKTVDSQLPVDAVSFGMKFASDVDAVLRLETPSAASAQTSVATLTSALPQVKMMMGGIGLDVAAGTLTLAQDKSAINASIKITQTEVKTLLAMVMQKKAAASAPPPTKPTTPPPPPSGGLGKKP